MKITKVTLVAAVTATTTGLCLAGGVTAGGSSSPIPAGSGRIPGNGLAPHAFVQKNPPSPAPYRPVGWGFNCHEAYGPTYYYPSEKSYEGLHPQYYPFFKPRLWPNYKADALEGGNCGSSRSCGFWDSYDDWMRGGRYSEKQ